MLKTLPARWVPLKAFEQEYVRVRTKCQQTFSAGDGEARLKEECKADPSLEARHLAHVPPRKREKTLDSSPHSHRSPGGSRQNTGQRSCDSGHLYWNSRGRPWAVAGASPWEVL